MREADERIVAENPHDIRARPPSMSDNLHDAARNGEIAKMEQLLAAGADINKNNVRLAPPSSLAPSPCSSSPARLPPPAARKRDMR